MQQQSDVFPVMAHDDGDDSAYRHQRMPDVPFASRGAQLAAAAAVRTVTLAALRTAGSALRSVRKNPLSFPIATRLEAQQEVNLPAASDGASRVGLRRRRATCRGSA